MRLKYITNTIHAAIVLAFPALSLQILRAKEKRRGNDLKAMVNAIAG